MGSWTLFLRDEDSEIERIDFDHRLVAAFSEVLILGGVTGVSQLSCEIYVLESVLVPCAQQKQRLDSHRSQKSSNF